MYLVFGSASLSALNSSVALKIPDLPALNSKAAVLIDGVTGTVMYEKNSNLTIPPASMTKLMSLYVVYSAIEKGEVDRDDIVTISGKADFRSLPPHSSLMFLEEGQEVSLYDLMLGLAVPSGNDAAIAIAEGIAGSVDAFVGLMNTTAVDMGLSSVHFEDASGLSEKNSVTAFDFAKFCSLYIDRFPYALEELHSVESFTYPKEENWKANGFSVYGPITQHNRNNLLSSYDPVDGLKTGYIDESGYNIALTAELDGRRLIAVILGGPGDNSAQGSLLRAIDGVSLLSYGFYRFINVKSQMTDINPVRIWKGSDKYLKVTVPELPVLTLKVENALLLHSRVVVPENIVAPVQRGDTVGEIIELSGDTVLGRYPVTAAEDILSGSLFRRFTYGLKVFVLKLTGKF
ncbi:MAG: D-alanyl-D-alanine carboxypeptidase [Spirochaetales bacterium]|nr:D-alanyl-D-alanine carboxypeptidase [Spirochaetales bacterium]